MSSKGLNDSPAILPSAETSAGSDAGAQRVPISFRRSTFQAVQRQLSCDRPTLDKIVDNCNLTSIDRVGTRATASGVFDQREDIFHTHISDHQRATAETQDCFGI